MCGNVSQAVSQMGQRAARSFGLVIYLSLLTKMYSERRA